jgi:endonuclease/exonuclease/phosphatase family metal-dependent hydrolase
MSGSVKSWGLCSNNTNPNSPKHNSVCVGNISEVFDQDLDLDFVTLQESTDFKKLIELSPQLKQMKYEVHSSGLDVMTTFWKSKYKLLYTIKGEFEKGRPWMATVFDNGYDSIICLINVHFGHYNTNEQYRKMENMLFTIKEEIRKKEDKDSNKYKEKRYIISGDFNYNIKDLGDSNKIIRINGNKFYYHPKHILTCCIKRRKHNDHIIDSMARPIDISIPKVNYMASDHKPIFVELVV